MKLVRLAGHQRDVQSVFPGEIAGASLKRRVPRPSLAQHRPVFPGEIAGASLKPGRPGGFGGRSGSGFPRRNRRGLIEAGGCRTDWTRHQEVFPGEIAGASLKLGGGRGRHGGGTGVFPGEIAGASLKR